MKIAVTALAIMVVTACQEPESESGVLRNVSKVSKPKPLYSYLDVTTQVNEGKKDPIRYALRVGYLNGKVTEVLVRSIKEDGDNFSGDEAANGCVDKFTKPTVTNRIRDTHYTITGAKKGVFVKIVIQKKPPEITGFTYKHAIESKYKKDANGQETSIANKQQFNEKYFPEDALLCDDSESPSTSESPGP